MDYTKIEKDNIDSSLINVETLQKEYEVVLQQYQEAVKNYISTLETTNTDTNSKPVYSSLKGRTWWGEGKVDEGVVETQEECETMCANSNDCSGATFNPVKRYCWARKGDGSLSVGEADDYALIPQQKQALIIMQELNKKLLSINEQITSNLNNINPEVEQQMVEQGKKRQELNKSYDQLLGQKTDIEKQLQEYNSIQEDNNNQSLYVTHQASSMKFWTIITAVVLLITMKSMYGDSSPPVIFTAVLGGIIALIVLTTLLGFS